MPRASGKFRHTKMKTQTNPKDSKPERSVARAQSPPRVMRRRRIWARDKASVVDWDMGAQLFFWWTRLRRPSTALISVRLASFMLMPDACARRGLEGDVIVEAASTTTTTTTTPRRQRRRRRRPSPRTPSRRQRAQSYAINSVRDEGDRRRRCRLGVVVVVVVVVVGRGSEDGYQPTGSSGGMGGKGGKDTEAQT